MQTAECRLATEHLLAYLENPDFDRAKVDTAISHISECPHCEGQIGYLVRALTTDEEDTLTCRECQAQLPDYLQADREGQAGGMRWRPVARHLETCPHCSAEYKMLSDLTALAYGERGIEPPEYPKPDLSFLQPEKAESPQPISIPWRLDELGRLIIEFSAELVRTFQSPAYAPTGLKSAQSPGTLCQFSLIEAVEDLEVTVIAKEKRDDPTYCTLMVKVNIPSRGGWPNLAKTEVILKQNEIELETQLTDAFGQVVFEGIATDDLPQLVLEVEPRRRGA